MQLKLTQYKQGPRTYWACQYRENGKPKRKYFGNVKTTSKGLARERFNAWLDGETPVDPNKSLVVGEVIEKYLEFFKQHRDPRNYTGRKRHLGFVIRHITRPPLDGAGEPLANLFAELLTDAHARQFIEARSKETTQSGLDENIKALKACWNWAANPYHISPRGDAGGGIFPVEHRPLANLKRMRPPEVLDVQKELLSQEDIQLLDAAAGKLTRSADMQGYLRFLALTGCRPGEAAAAKKEDYDGTAIVLAKHKTAYCKAAPRVITLSGRAKEIVESKPDGLLFGCESVPYFAGLLRDIRHDENLTLYGFRHTYITNRILAGDPLPMVAEHCGTSVAMITKTYFHATRQAMQAQAQRAAADLDSMYE
ncbi:tyrosine-type recombinase/integrase [Rhodopirellula halodulae]|uniref:tyrosine-type recombinase/integrase n=1 Tax=Rhodopirellula halodulae TaxID=2894198 RepID=UPI001E3AB0D9|nr:hypothetical protein [Rhodopirellula sp. JC737]MCC9655616.1 hypothetical protein [Rhodopirellula sp. JC737]